MQIIGNEAFPFKLPGGESLGTLITTNPTLIDKRRAQNAIAVGAMSKASCRFALKRIRWQSSPFREELTLSFNATHPLIAVDPQESTPIFISVRLATISVPNWFPLF